MRTFDEYLEQRPKDVPTPQKGSLPTVSDWLLLASLDLPSGKLWIGDPAMAADEEAGIVARLTPGSYSIDVKAAEYGSEVRVSHLRVANESAGDRAEQLGEVSVDGGSVGVCDQGAFDATDVDPDALADLLDELAQEKGLSGVVDVQGVPLVCAESGFGDGSFPVFAIVTNGQRVGVEIEFISADTPHPFGSVTMPQPKTGFLSRLFGGSR